MDVGDPSNAARIFDLYGGDWESLTADISGATVSDPEILETIRDCRRRYGYLLDPHGACGFNAVYHNLAPGESVLLCETAHPAKFKETVENASGERVELPERLAAFLRGQKQSVPMSKDYNEFKTYLSKLK